MLLTKKLDAVTQLIAANQRLVLRQGAVIATPQDAIVHEITPCASGSFATYKNR